MSARLARKVLSEKLELAAHELLVQRDEEVRRSQVTVVFRYLVLEDEMIPEGVPSELAGESMILVQIVSRVREDDIGTYFLQLLERLFDIRTRIGKEALAMCEHPNVVALRRLQKRTCARGCLVATGALGREDDPGDMIFRTGTGQHQQRYAAADIDVVCMTANRQHPLDR